MLDFGKRGLALGIAKQRRSAALRPSQVDITTPEPQYPMA